MTIPNTYSNLILAVQEELEDTGSEFVLNIPSAIRTAELRINREVDGLYQDTSTTLNATAGNGVVAKPADYKFCYDLFINTVSGRKPLDKKTVDYLKDYWPIASEQGEPKYYGDVGTTGFLLVPTPNANYSIEIRYGSFPPFLSSSNQTNQIIQKYQDLLWYATLVEQTTFARMYEASAKYEASYQRALMGIKTETGRERQDNTNSPKQTYSTQNRMEN